MRCSARRTATALAIVVIIAISAYKSGLTTSNASHQAPAHPKSRISRIERSVDTGKVRASPQNARVARKPDVSDWNQSEPVVIFINQYSAMNYIYDNSATRWEKDTPSCPNVRCRMTHDEQEKATADGLLLNRFVPLLFREQLRRYHDKQVVFVLNMEGEKEKEWKDPEITSKFDFKIGYSLTSDLPMLYGCGGFDGIDIVGSLITRFEEGKIQPPVNRHGVVAMVSNCQKVTNDRLSVLQAMMKSLKVASFGKCENNMNTTSTRFNNPNWHKMKVDIFKDYKFGMAYESKNLPEYVTEKIYSCLHTGVIPIYHGAADVEKFVPKGSYIDASQFSSTDELIAYIKKVDSSPDLYASYFKWDITGVKRLHQLYCSVPIQCQWCEMVAQLRHKKRQQT